MKENWVQWGCVRLSLFPGSLPGNRKAKLNPEGFAAQTRMVEACGLWGGSCSLRKGELLSPRLPLENSKQTRGRQRQDHTGPLSCVVLEAHRAQN